MLDLEIGQKIIKKGKVVKQKSKDDSFKKLKLVGMKRRSKAALPLPVQ